MTRDEHIASVKSRALAYCVQHDTTSALASVMSDLGKHPETARHAAIELGMLLAMAGQLSTNTAMRDFIEGIR
jgi:hypothetical protein